MRLPSLGSVLDASPAVLFAYLFGSASRGRLSPLSEVDVALYLDETCDPLEARLEAIGRATAYLGTGKVDVVVLNQAPIALVGRILQSRRVLCDRDPFHRHRFESLALREFADFRVFEGRILSRRLTDG